MDLGFFFCIKIFSDFTYILESGIYNLWFRKNKRKEKFYEDN